ncbi:LacI family DNA-binding transcriptional regulator [Roseburia hominis]
MKCTIKQLAEELHLSRNTVSKALKNSNDVSPHTKQRVLKKAKELNYTDIDLIDSPLPVHGHSNTFYNGSILFLTKTYAQDSEFWTTVLKGIDKILSNAHYHLLIGIMSESDLKKLEFPASIKDPSVKGIIIVEICNEDVCKALLDYHLPIVSIDMPREYDSFMGKLDVITMENKMNIHQITDRLIRKGAKRFSFVGDLSSRNVSRGFQERYDALCEALEYHHLSLDQECSLFHETDEDFHDFQLIIKSCRPCPLFPMLLYAEMIGPPYSLFMLYSFYNIRFQEMSVLLDLMIFHRLNASVRP